QIDTVEVYAWSVKDGEAIVGRAQKSDPEGGGGSARSGPAEIGSALHTRPTLRVRAAVHTQAEADARAAAILDEHARGFLTGEGESIGLPEIVPDTKIGLGKVGTTFAKTYYLTAVKHKIDGSGYRTTFSVELKKA